jgi:glycosyltransferase involved in cell wall biosynthesis
MSICFVGPLVGGVPGRVTTQEYVLAQLFEAAGYEIFRASEQPTRIGRLVNTLSVLLRHGHKLDIVAVSIYGGLSFVLEDVAGFLARRFGIPVVLFLHGGALPEFFARYPAWARRVMGRANVIAAPSKYLARAAEAQGWNVRVVPNVIDLDRYPFRLRRSIRPRLFWMRTFHPVWNPEMGIRVLGLLKREFPDAELVMAGEDRGFRSEVEELAATCGVADAVRFPGFLNMQRKIEEGSRADIFISTNRIDNVPVAIVEAWALGLPVISTQVGGIADLIEDGRTGLLVPSEDAGAMVNGIKRLLREPDLAEHLSRCGREECLRFGWHRVRQQWEEMFMELRPEGVRAAATTGVR